MVERVRVTVVNRDPEMIALLRELLAERGFDVETHADAMPGIDDIVRSRPDLLIVDLDLAPEREQLTGLQVIHSARSGDALRDTPVIVVATDPHQLAAEWADLMERGDVHRLIKPFDLATFDRVVETALKLPHGKADAPGAGKILAEQDRVEPGGEHHAR